MLKITHNDVKMTEKRKNAILAVSFYAKKLRIMKYDAEIHVAFKFGYTELFGIHAQCDYDYSGKITIDIDAKTHDYIVLAVLAHEMVHARQYLDGRLSEKKGLRLWKGAKVPASMSYVNEPWEREAMRKEVILSHQFLESMK